MNNEEKILSMLEGLVEGQKGLEARFDRVEARLDGVDERFNEMDKSNAKRDDMLEMLVVGQRKLLAGQKKLEAGQKVLQKDNESMRQLFLRMELGHGEKIAVLNDGQVALEDYHKDHEHRISSLEDIAEKHAFELVSLRNAK